MGELEPPQLKNSGLTFSVTILPLAGVLKNKSIWK